MWIIFVITTCFHFIVWFFITSVNSLWLCKLLWSLLVFNVFVRFRKKVSCLNNKCWCYIHWRDCYLKSFSNCTKLEKLYVTNNIDFHNNVLLGACIKTIIIRIKRERQILLNVQKENKICWLLDSVIINMSVFNATRVINSVWL